MERSARGFAASGGFATGSVEKGLAAKYRFRGFSSTRSLRNCRYGAKTAWSHSAVERSCSPAPFWALQIKGKATS
jgi:hypothetical protein